MSSLGWIVIAVVTAVGFVSAETTHSVTGQIGAGNTTYYKMASNDAVIIELVSLTGDADLYVSDETSEPSWSNYEAQSTTCGIERIYVPSVKQLPVADKFKLGNEEYDPADFHDPLLDEVEHTPGDSLVKKFKRPVYIGVYGHSGFEVSRFRLSLHVMGDSSGSSGAQSRSTVAADDDDDDESASPFWQFVLAVLQLLLEIII